MPLFIYLTLHQTNSSVKLKIIGYKIKTDYVLKVVGKGLLEEADECYKGDLVKTDLYRT